MQLSSFGVVANEYTRFFKNTAEIKYLKMAEKALKRAVKIAAVGQADYHRALARNYISQHRFKEALKHANVALDVGGGRLESQYLLFDVHMELGNYHEAERYLESFKNMYDSGYLIRLAKWNDYKGDLKTTIRLMERVKQKVLSSKNKEIQLWVFTNLADYYGHAGRIKDAYQHYLKALQLDPKNAYAKKGIAWIVFSYEKNAQEAMRILDEVTKTLQAPDYYLLKAQIAEYMAEDQHRLDSLDKYYSLVQNPEYGIMYNIPNAELFLEHPHQYKRGLQLAEEEVKNRPTPEAYGLLAYAYLKDGQTESAMEIAESQILGKTYEPAILLYAAEIYKAGGITAKVVELRSELSEAAYELGPVKASKIQDL
ncbi:MAG: tetratricopeptide repeat protein [Flavobacteriaceae bacterium]